MSASAEGGAAAVDSILQEGHRLMAAGRTADAERVFRRVLSMDAANPEAEQMIGVITYQKGDKSRGKAMVEDVLKRAPSHFGALVNFGVMVHFDGDNERAAELFRRAIEANPSSDKAHHHYGFVLGSLGRLEESERALRKAVELNPDLAEAHFNLGNALQLQGKPLEAKDAFERAIRLRPAYVEAWTNLGNLHLSLGDHRAAIDAYQKAIAANPRIALPYANLGTTLMIQGSYEEAEKWFLKAVDVDPRSSDGWYGLGALRRERGEIGLALEAFDAALRINPNETRALVRKAQSLQEIGSWREALEALDPAFRTPSVPGEIRVLHALLLPVINMSVQEIEDTRRRVAERVSKVIEDGIKVPMPEKQVGMTNFYLAYHRDNEIELQKDIARMYLSACPELGYVAPHCEPGARRMPSDRIRLGILTAYFREHTIGKLFGPIVGQLDKSKFEVTFYHAPSPFDSTSQRIADSAEHTVRLPADGAYARAVIAERMPDILFYPEVGMDPGTYYLAFARLAPVQAMTWGHPVTTGIPNMDYFVSTEALELPGSEKEYTETLIRLPDLTTYYVKPAEPAEPPSRERFGFSQDARLYVCPQTLFKLHPDFDGAIGEILRRDPNGRAVFISGRFPTWESLLRERFAASIPDVADRVAFVPQMPLPDFLNLCRVADALIDPFYFVGGNSSAEAFAFGCPIVTLPGRLLRARITYAWYAKLGILDAVADGPEHYVELAVRLANDADWRAELRRRILERNHLMFENESAVRQLETVFEKAHRAALEGRKLAPDELQFRG